MIPTKQRSGTKKYIKINLISIKIYSNTVYDLYIIKIIVTFLLEISFGDIPNSSSIDILKPCAIFDYIGAFLRRGFAHVDNVIPVIKTITWLLLSRLQGNKYTGTLRNLNLASGTYANTRRNSSEPSGTFRTLPPEPTPTRAGTLRNPPEPSTTFRNQPFGTFRNLLPPEPPPAYTGTLRNLPEPSGNLPPEPTPLFYTGTLRNLPQPASGTYTSIRRNLPERSRTRPRNLHQHTPEPSGTFRNLPPEPAPATRTGTHRNLSGLKTPLAYAVGEKSNRPSNLKIKNPAD